MSGKYCAEVDYFSTGGGFYILECPFRYNGKSMFMTYDGNLFSIYNECFGNGMEPYSNNNVITSFANISECTDAEIRIYAEFMFKLYKYKKNQ